MAKVMSLPKLDYKHSWPSVNYEYPNWWNNTQFDNYIEDTDDILFKVSPCNVRERGDCTTHSTRGICFDMRWAWKVCIVPCLACETSLIGWNL